MNELEICDNLGILSDPDQNRLSVTRDLRESIIGLAQAFYEMTTQKKAYGNLNPDLWLEFIPWHSLN